MNQSDSEKIKENREKPKIGWVEISSKKYGGFIYRQQARDALAGEFDVELVSCEPKLLRKFKYFKLIESAFKILFLKEKKDIWIRDYFPAVLSPFKKMNGKNVIMIHHIDISGLPLISRPFFHILTKIFYHNLRKADAIITRAEIWQKHFLSKGYKNVYKIYGGSDLKRFDITDEEIEQFKKENRLEDKPIIYIGNCQKAKGVVQTYNALKHLNAHLVTTGQKDVEIPAKHFDLSYDDYLKMLKASSVVITMSQFKEGWCRTAHEAMLCKAPVIGSGAGGMKELLLGGGQIICNDFEKLKKEVERLLNNRTEAKKLGENGYNFVKEFTLERFNREWRETIKNILKS